MKLKNVKSVVQLGKWLQEQGISPGEHSKFGGVHPVHTTGSLHYRDLALDVNDRGIDDTLIAGRRGFDTEHEVLRWLYGRILGVAEANGWPLDEMFFNGFGFIKERGFDHNHPITGHDGHLHVGFTRAEWR